MGHDSCDLRRHLDSLAPETPIWDIVDLFCRAWESHADTEAWRPNKPRPKRALPIYTVEEPASAFDNRMVDTVLRRLLPTPIAPAPPSKPVPTELESLLHQLLGGVQVPTPTPPAKTGITEIETLLQSLLSATPVPASRVRSGPISRDWATVVCFSCGKVGHGVSRCPELKETLHLCCQDGRQRNWEAAMS